VEVPRGILYHMYEFDEKGRIARADCVIPTSQNHANIQHDIAALAEELAGRIFRTRISSGSPPCWFAPTTPVSPVPCTDRREAESGYLSLSPPRPVTEHRFVVELPLVLRAIGHGKGSLAIDLVIAECALVFPAVREGEVSLAALDAALKFTGIYTAIGRGFLPWPFF